MNAVVYSLMCLKIFTKTSQKLLLELDLWISESTFSHSRKIMDQKDIF